MKLTQGCFSFLPDLTDQQLSKLFEQLKELKDLL
jgi:hypothetical protein